MMKTRHIIYLLFFAMLMTACAEMEVCESGHPHQAQVGFSYDWRDYQTKPDNMGVIVYRVVGQSKQLVQVNTATQKVNGQDRIGIGEGDYKFITFPYDKSELDYSEVDSFMTHPSAEWPLQSVCFSYKQYEKDDPALRKRPTGWDGKTLSAWDDYNGYSGLYIQPDVDILFYDTTQVVKAADSQDIMVNFQPRQMSQNIDFYFDIQKIVKDAPFVIDNVWAQVSGVPRRINLNSGHLDITHTNKIMFPVDLTNSKGVTGSTGDNVDTEDNTVLHCHGNVNVPGIVNVQQRYGESLDDVRRKTNGPGIMQVIIYGHADKPKKKRRRWQGIINLYEALNTAQLIKITPDGKYAMLNGENGTVRVNAVLKMDGQSILKDLTGGDAVEEWIPTVSISLDI